MRCGVAGRTLVRGTLACGWWGWESSLGEKVNRVALADVQRAKATGTEGDQGGVVGIHRACGFSWRPLGIYANDNRIRASNVQRRRATM